jgi:error-prone DNA polymerase
MCTAIDLIRLAHGFPVQIAGMAICRQRPGTANGHCFISLEDEAGIANLFVPKTTFHAYKLVITAESFLLAEGRVQIGEGNQATVFVTSIRPMPGSDAALTSGSHDFH